MGRADEAKKTIKIENVVASTVIGQKIDLISVAQAMEGADYDPKRFPGLIYRTKDPKTAALIFGTGKIVSTGAKSIADVDRGLRKVFEKLASMGIEIGGQPEITVQNIVASADLGTALELSAIAIGLDMENIEYEPEQFPGLVYRINSPKVVVLIFGTGKLVITGGKKPQDAEAAVELIVRELKGLALI